MKRLTLNQDSEIKVKDIYGKMYQTSFTAAFANFTTMKIQGSILKRLK